MPNGRTDTQSDSLGSLTEPKVKNVFAHRMTLSPIKVLNVNQTQEEYESHSWSTLLGSVMKRIRELTRIPSANMRTVPITRLHI